MELASTDRQPKGALVSAGLLLTVALHGGLFGFLWWQRGRAPETKPEGPSVFFDAQLVKFGKPRDMSFLPHKQGVVKPPPENGIKVAKSMDALPNLEKKDKPKDDPLSKTHADLFKNLPDPDQAAAVDPGEGSLTGSKAGTATVAKGDPYLLEIIDKIGSAWTIPTPIADAELAKLSADACLTIAEDGTLSAYKITRPSGNSIFDSSLEATLSTVKKISPPPDRFRAIATRGRLCPTFSKQ